MDNVVSSCAKLFPIKNVNCQPISDGNLQQCARAFQARNSGIPSFPPPLLSLIIECPQNPRPARCVPLFRRVRDGLFLISRQGYSVVLCCAKLFPIKTINCQSSSDGNLQQCARAFQARDSGIPSFPPSLLRKPSPSQYFLSFIEYELISSARLLCSVVPSRPPGRE